MRKSRRENEWRDLRAHGLIGPEAPPASFSHVIRNGGWIARRPSRFTSNCIVKYEKNSRAAVLIPALPVCLPPLGKARRLMQRSRRSIPHSTSKISKPF